MKKKFKAFTLIELIVVMVIMGILMTAIIRMMQPINSVYSTSTVISSQRAIEQGIVSYIVENTRYAQSIGVYQKQDSADAAMNLFLAKNPTDMNGTALTKADLEVIVISNKEDYLLNNGSSMTYNGRLIRKKSTATTCPISQPFKYDGTGNSYMAMGEGYYGTADYYIRIENFTPAGFDVVVDSDYYYGTGSKNNKFERTDASTNYTKSTVVLSNTAVPPDKAAANTVVKFVDVDPVHIDSTVGTRSNMEYNTYIVYSLK